MSSGLADPASLRNFSVRFDVSGEQIAKRDQTRNIHDNASLNESSLHNLVFLKQGVSIWPGLSESQDCEYVLTTPLKRKMHRSIAKQLNDVMRVCYRYSHFIFSHAFFAKRETSSPSA
jgi:hypothetical protein